MDIRLVAAVTTEKLKRKVTEICDELGVSRKTFYKWRERYREGGLAALEEGSRRPKRSPNQTPVHVEDAIVRLRKELAGEGLDAGAATIRYHLAREDLSGARVPSESTIWRVLVRRGFVTPEPKKRPKKAWRRFTAAFPNECWQIDATHWMLADGSTVEIVNILDDHSRLAVASHAVLTTSCATAWAAFSSAVRRFGLPLRCLSDNGLAFSGKLRGIEVPFEANLRAAGVTPTTARPFHPQTCGKVERFHQTLKKWLAARPLPDTLAELQELLDTFTAYYNHHRPHRGIGRRTPIEAWTATPRLAAGEPLTASESRQVRTTVTDRGMVSLHRYVIHVGVAHRARRALVQIEAGHANVFIDEVLVRHLQLDPTRRYQPSKTPRA